MNLTDIETFLTIVETRNITKTAESLFVTQPTVSRRLQNLEEEVGIELIRRKKGMKQIELTEKGEAFVLVAERWISVWQEMNLIRQEDSGTLLTVSSIDTFNTAVLAPIYRSLIENSENRIRLHVQTHHSANIYRLVEQRQADIGFVLFNLNFKNVNVKPIAREKMVVVQRDCGAALHQAQLHTDELADRTEVHFRGDINFQNWHSQWISYGSISPICGHLQPAAAAAVAGRNLDHCPRLGGGTAAEGHAGIHQPYHKRGPASRPGGLLRHP